MVEENIFLVVIVFICTVLIFFLGSNKYLRPKVFIDIYTTFYLLVGSMVSLHILIFKLIKVDYQFILMYTCSMLMFTVAFIYSSYYFGIKLNNRFRVSELNSKRCIPNVDNIFLIKSYCWIFIISFCFSILVAWDSYQKFSLLSDLHGENTAYITENYSSKLISYMSSFIGISNTYFMFYIYACNSKNMQKNILCIFYLALQGGIALMSTSRLSLLSIFMPLGLISFYLYYYNYVSYRKLIKFQFIAVMLGICYAIYLGYHGDTAFQNVIKELGMRLMLTSDVALWYHVSGSLDLSMFSDYNYLYYIYPALKVLNLVEFNSGLGPFIAQLAGNQDFGKGPIPTFIYESYLISKSSLYTILYSLLLGILVPYLRYLSIKYMLLSGEKKKYFLFSLLYFTVGPVGDYLNFLTSLPALIVILFVFYFILHNRNAGAHIQIAE